MAAEGGERLVRGVLSDFEVRAVDGFAAVGEAFAGFVFLPGEGGF